MNGPKKVGHIAVKISTLSHRRSPGFLGSHTCSALRSFVLLLLLALFFLAPAHAGPLSFQVYAQRDGLASDYVTSILFGPGGAVWIGTPNGATNVQDKYWVTYTTAHGLGGNWVSGMALGGDGKLYFATNGGGLTLFDGAARKTYNTSNSGIPSNYLTGVAIDKQNRIWVGTFGAGVARLEGEQWTRLTLANNYVNALALDASGHPWVATNEGAFFYDGQNWTRLSQATGLASNRVSALTIAPDGRVWFGTDSGATVYDGRRYRTYREADGLPDGSVRAIAVDAQNRAWFGTARGLALLEGSQWKTYALADGLAHNQVTTLALDAQKNVWAGTASGLSVLGASLQRPTTLPVVLVHGWHGPDSDKFEDSEFRFIKNYMERDGITPVYASGISPNRTLFQNAARLRDVIAETKTKTGAPKVDILAFSMGGLNTRAYLESTLYQNDVRRAIILGTPQAGVRTWYPLLTREIQDRPTEPSTIELTPEYAELFNRTHAPRPTVPYDLLIGDARDQPGLDLLKLFPPGDGLISVWSAHALTGPLVRHITNSDVHAWNPSPRPVDVASYLFPEQTYERFFRNAFRDGEARPIGFAAAPAPAVAPRNTTPLNVDTLRGGESVTRLIDVDAARSVRFFARWTSGDVNLSLRAPDGTRYTPDSFRQATYLKADIGSFVGYAILRAQAGTWSLTIQREDKGDAPITVTSYADLDADLRMNVSTDREWYPLGASVVVSATLSNRATHADVRARIEWLGDGVSPRGASTEVKLLEEGERGTYAEAITDLPHGGYYMLRIIAFGTSFARERQVLFAVSPGTAAFAAPAGTAKAQARVEGSPGKYSALVVEAPVNVKRAGEFALAATLRDARGQLVTALTAPQALQAGAQRATISIPGRDLRARGLDGPYTIDLVLMDASWAAIQVDEAKHALTTDALRAGEFGE